MDNLINNSFKNEASEFVYIRTYSRWIESELRRETWNETVERYLDFIQKHLGHKIPKKVIKKIREGILSFGVMPSMRFLWAAGEPAELENITIYNCSFAAADNIDIFHECLYILMCGTGFGYSVEDKYVSQLPTISNDLLPVDRIHVVEDSRIGWAESVKDLIYSLYSGQDISHDYNKLRPAGARLKTMGGRSSGPAPLAQLHSFIRDTFYSAKGRRLTSLEVSDILNEIAQIVVVGGVRRSSEIGLSDLENNEIRDAKTGNFPVRRYMSNNSAVYNTKPDIVTFMKEWTALASSGTGERGIFNLEASKSMAPKRRDPERIAGTNPCGEIQLRSNEFCNLSEVVIRSDDTIDSVLEKIETATWMGIIQACFTDFKYINTQWKKNCDEERLLGVSLTGQFDNPEVCSDSALRAYKSKAIKIAKKASEIMCINMPSAITCTKPSGTVSELVDSASGIHPRFSKYYIRRYRISANDPLFRMIKDQGVPVSPENGQRKQDYVKALRIFESTQNQLEGMRLAKSVCPIFDNQGWSSDKVTTWVTSFPVSSPDGSIVASDLTAIDQLEWYKKVQNNWCEHNASITVYVRNEEWLEVGDWVYKNWNIVNGISFLPYSEHLYDQAPYEAISKDKYEELIKTFPKIDYSKLSDYEKEDNTEGAKSLACVSGICEV